MKTECSECYYSFDKSAAECPMCGKANPSYKEKGKQTHEFWSWFEVNLPYVFLCFFAFLVLIGVIIQFPLILYFLIPFLVLVISLFIRNYKKQHGKLPIPEISLIKEITLFFMVLFLAALLLVGIGFLGLKIFPIHNMSPENLLYFAGVMFGFIFLIIIIVISKVPEARKLALGVGLVFLVMIPIVLIKMMWDGAFTEKKSPPEKVTKTASPVVVTPAPLVINYKKDKPKTLNASKTFLTVQDKHPLVEFSEDNPKLMQNISKVNELNRKTKANDIEIARLKKEHDQLKKKYKKTSDLDAKTKLFNKMSKKNSEILKIAIEQQKNAIELQTIQLETDQK